MCRQKFRLCDVRPNFTLQNLLQEHLSSEGHLTSGYLGSAPSLPSEQLVRTANASKQQQAGRQKRLEFLGLPPKMAATVADEDRSIGLRLFLLDNSGSTAAYDGKVIEELPDGTLAIRACSRWDEIKRMALDHAEWNAQLGTPCEFVLLNPRHSPPVSGVDFVRLDAHDSAARCQIAALKDMLDSSGPGGPTPIRTRIRELHQRVLGSKAALQRAGLRVVLCCVTDGLPTGSTRQELVQTLRCFMQELPVCVTIRLCTDDSNVADFYSDVERDLELPLDVLDDLQGEAREIAKKGNGWFVYTPAMHRLREGGTFVKVFDLLDERLLTAVEAALFAQMLLRRDGEPPLPDDPAEFCQTIDVISEISPGLPSVYCIWRKAWVKQVDPWGLRCCVMGFWTSLTKVLSTLIVQATSCNKSVRSISQEQLVA